MTSAKFAELFDGPARQPDAWITQRERDLARFDTSGDRTIGTAHGTSCSSTDGRAQAVFIRWRRVELCC